MRPLSIAVIEKGREAGLHQLSGALLDPSTLKDLIPDFASKGAPLGTPVDNDNIYFLTQGSKFRLPITPPSVSLLTARGPYADRMAACEALMARDPRIANATICGGFVFSDLPKCGMTVTVTVRGWSNSRWLLGLLDGAATREGDTPPA